MAYNKFTLGVIIRVLLIFGVLVVISRLWQPDRRFFTLLLAAGVLTGQVIEMIHFVHRTNRQLIRFVDAIRSQGTTSRAMELGDPSFRKLNQSFNQVLDTLQQAHLERESQHQLLEKVVWQAQAGIMLQDARGRLPILNPAAREMLRLPDGSITASFIREKLPLFYEKLLKPEEMGKTVFAFTDRDGRQHYISGIRHTFRLMESSYKLVTFQDITREMEQKEMESWQKLIRTLSHEILNSVTPISSLTETGLQIIDQQSGPIQEQQAGKLRRALSAIDKRSNGLYEFVNDVRRLVRLPEPKKEKIAVQSLLEDVAELMAGRTRQAGIRLSLDAVPAELTIAADRHQMEQVLINLMLNALDALQDTPAPRLDLRARREEQGTCIEVADNGPGMNKESLQQIFIPFFSTKKTGSGIGLSLSRQIIQQHGGQLTVHSEPGKGSVFQLLFNNS